LKLNRLKVRADFLRCAAGIRRVAPGMTLEACATLEKFAKPRSLRVGFTASRKVGNAVTRNRAKRRLRAAAAALLPLYGREGHDYVLVARAGTAAQPFAELLEDLAVLLKAAHAKLGRSASGGAS
jgi:ribonuclease P protein component